jgi:hypothetical protein
MIQKWLEITEFSLKPIKKSIKILKTYLVNLLTQVREFQLFKSLTGVQ